MTGRISRPQYIRDQVRQEQPLARLRSAARQWAAAVDRGAGEERVGELAYAVRWEATNCRHAGCTDDVLRAALRAAGVITDAEQAERGAFLAEVATGLPDELRKIIMGGSQCP